MLSRRAWLRTSSLLSLGAVATACGKQLLSPLENPEEGHLVSRAGTPIFAPQLGTTTLNIGTVRDGLRFVPSTYRAGEPLPLLLTLHGAGGNGYGGMQPFLALAEAARVILVSPDSRQSSWDRRYGAFGDDVRFIDNALSDTYLRCAVDPARIAIAGFSDGASYALSLGLTNGDLFSSIMAFSPGFMVPNVGRGKPAVFIAHGTNDDVLPIDSTSRVFVPQLRALNYPVTYEEFDGTHQLRPDTASHAFAWWQSSWASHA